jgi:hypothetical protein
MSRFTLLTGGTSASPLRSVCGDELSDSEIQYDHPAGAAGRRTKSDGDVGFALLDGDLDSPSSNEGGGPSPGKKRGRKFKWSSGSDMKLYEREAKEREVEKLKEMAGFELGPTKGNKREKRRMQNRLAQRAFRARSKIQKKEVGSGGDAATHPLRSDMPGTNARVALQVANHMSYLEALAEAQAERLDMLTELVDRLQRKNTSLKQARWSSAYGVFAGYDQHVSPETKGSSAQVSQDSTLVDRAEAGEAGRQ